MKLSIWPFTIAAAIIWGLVMLLTGIANLIWPTYGVAFLEMLASIYPGYHGAGNFGAVIVGTLYAALDGAVFGLVLALLYNAFAGSAPKGEAKG
jgi:hypothetical protein